MHTEAGIARRGVALILDFVFLSAFFFPVTYLYSGEWIMGLRSTCGVSPTPSAFCSSQSFSPISFLPKRTRAGRLEREWWE